MDNNQFLDRVAKDQKVLESARLQLKDKFIGTDDTIDRIIDTMALWYLAPELQRRPLIICLWGTTGVGKTDLVRSLVKFLNKNDKFIEIQMDQKIGYIPTIQSVIEDRGISEQDQSVLLLDEIQRFRSMDEEGKLIQSYDYSDVWMLLSDGKFPSVNFRKTELLKMIIEDRYEKEMERVRAETPPPPSEDEAELTNVKAEDREFNNKMKYKMCYWSAAQYKKLMKDPRSVEEIMHLSAEDRIDAIKESLESDDVCDGASYKKMLIFISGNIDEAYHMANEVNNSDIPADVYHEHSKKIKVTHIKEALNSKFKPEQIARFGNNHVIYPTLSSDSFRKIIHKQCTSLFSSIQEAHGVSITAHQSVLDVIYANGVFPAQGVRPVLSTIAQILECNVPYFLFSALSEKIETIQLQCDGDKLSSTIGSTEVVRSIYNDIDKIKSESSVHDHAIAVVHELGHALVYAVLSERSPLQINFNASVVGAGYILTAYPNLRGVNAILEEAAVLFGGVVAEGLVFGEKKRSIGSYSDINKATQSVNFLVKCGAHTRSGSYENPFTASGPDNNKILDIQWSVPIVEQLLKEQKIRAADIIQDNLPLYKKLVSEGLKLNTMEDTQFISICAEYNLIVKQDDIENPHNNDYVKLVNGFLEN